MEILFKSWKRVTQVYMMHTAKDQYNQEHKLQASIKA